LLRHHHPCRLGEIGPRDLPPRPTTRRSCGEHQHPHKEQYNITL
jgi:hypothetical protein